MKQKLLAILLFSFVVAACSTNLSDPRNIKEGVHKDRALKLLQRSPESDASVFYHVGGIGYIMTYGGLRVPIGVDSSESRDFQSLEVFAPILFSEVSPLLQDPDGRLTMDHFVGGAELTRERQFYQDVRGNYAVRFNRRMQKLTK